MTHPLTWQQRLEWDFAITWAEIHANIDEAAEQAKRDIIKPTENPAPTTKPFDDLNDALANLCREPNPDFLVVSQAQHNAFQQLAAEAAMKRQLGNGIGQLAQLGGITGVLGVQQNTIINHYTNDPTLT